MLRLVKRPDDGDCCTACRDLSRRVTGEDCSPRQDSNSNTSLVAMIAGSHGPTRKCLEVTRIVAGLHRCESAEHRKLAVM